MIVAAAVIAIGISLFSSPKPAERSTLAAPPQGFKQPPGGTSTPYFIEQTKEAEKERQESAIKTGGSALPTPIGANPAIEEMTAEKQKERSSRRVACADRRTEAKDRPDRTAETGATAASKTREQFDDSLAQAMQKQLQQLQTSWDPKGIKEVGGKTDERDEEREKTEKEEKDREKNGMGMAGGGAGMSGASGQKFGKPIINAGTVSYAQMLTEANSDTPGPSSRSNSFRPAQRRTGRREFPGRRRLSCPQIFSRQFE